MSSRTRPELISSLKHHKLPAQKKGEEGGKTYERNYKKKKGKRGEMREDGRKRGGSPGGRIGLGKERKKGGNRGREKANELPGGGGLEKKRKKKFLGKTRKEPKELNRILPEPFY